MTADNTAAIMEILRKRMRQAEDQILASPEFARLKAYNTHMLMEHGTAELCSCPEWNDARPQN